MSSYSSVRWGYRLVSGHLKMTYLGIKAIEGLQKQREEVAEPEARHWEIVSEKTLGRKWCLNGDRKHDEEISGKKESNVERPGEKAKRGTCKEDSVWLKYQDQCWVREIRLGEVSSSQIIHSPVSSMESQRKLEKDMIKFTFKNHYSGCDVEDGGGQSKRQRGLVRDHPSHSNVGKRWVWSGPEQEM